MMKVYELLLKRTTLDFSPQKDAWLKEIVKSNPDEFSVVLFSTTLNNKKNTAARFIRENYYVNGIFDMSSPLCDYTPPFCLYTFSKHPVTNIKYGIYRTHLKPTRDKTETGLKNDLPDSYRSYLCEVEKFIESNKIPEDTDDWEFGKFKASKRNEDHWTPFPYGKENKKILAALEKEKPVPLSSVATIIYPKRLSEKGTLSFVLSPANWEYPIDYNKIGKGVASDCLIMKNDILFLNGRFFFIYDSPQKDLYVSPLITVIRPTGIDPTYLFLYLSSDTLKSVIQSLDTGLLLCPISKKDLETLPVAPPRREPAYYHTIFSTRYLPIETISEFGYSIKAPKQTEDPTLEDIFDEELVRNMTLYKADVVQKTIEQDLKELNICFSHKAYKATLILAGSILEAVLIDWLSEIDGENHFEHSHSDYNLCEYINHIRSLKQPLWIDGAEKAHFIRKKRNTVHAKLAIKSDSINEKTCRMVIDYLEYVIRTRNELRQH